MKPKSDEDNLAEVQQEHEQLLAQLAQQSQDYQHAQRKITQQGQEQSRSRAELNAKQREIENLQSQLQQSQANDYNQYFEDSTQVQPKHSSETDQILQRLNQMEQVQLGMSQAYAAREQQRYRETQVRGLEEKIGLNPKDANAYYDALTMGNVADAAKIVRLAEKQQALKKSLQLDKRRRRGIQTQPVSSSGSPPAETETKLDKALKDMPSGKDRIRKMAEMFYEDPSLIPDG